MADLDEILYTWIRKFNTQVKFEEKKREKNKTQSTKAEPDYTNWSNISSEIVAVSIVVAGIYGTQLPKYVQQSFLNLSSPLHVVI